MDFSVYLPIVLLLFFLISQDNQAKRHFFLRRKHQKLQKGRVGMNDFINEYLGQECLVYLGLGTTVTGVLESVQDGWVTVASKKDRQVVNLDYITRIRLFPKNKNGKKKAFVAD